MNFYALAILSLFILPYTSKAQNSDCFEIKYLDFFGLNDQHIRPMPDSVLNRLLISNFTDIEYGKNYKTNWLIPLVVLQLRYFHPACDNSVDTTQYNKLVQIYFNIRQEDKSVVNGKTMSQQLEFIRQDYYDQVLNDSILPYMTFTLDDGPLYGQVPTDMPALEDGTFVSTDFGGLTIVKSNEKMYLVATDAKQEVLWSRIMTGTYDRILRNLEFKENPVYKSSRAYEIAMYADGERLTVLLSLNGDFMYYYHSW